MNQTIRRMDRGGLCGPAAALGGCRRATAPLLLHPHRRTRSSSALLAGRTPQQVPLQATCDRRRGPLLVRASNTSSSSSDNSNSAASTAPAAPAARRRPAGAFSPRWPSNYKRRLEPATLERAHEADVTPTVFDFALWRRHRSRTRYVEHLVTMAQSYFILDLAAPVLALTAMAVFVGCYETGLQSGALPDFLPNIAMAAEGPFNSVSFAMSLMLAFKTNVSYARWNEARCLWGSLVNRSRNLVRQVRLLSSPLSHHHNIIITPVVISRPPPTHTIPSPSPTPLAPQPTPTASNPTTQGPHAHAPRPGPPEARPGALGRRVLARPQDAPEGGRRRGGGWV
jgi:hypothetical protein